MKRWTVAVISMVVAGGLVVAFFMNDANRYAITNSSGSISSGGRFGVRIGDNIENAKMRLQQNGFTHVFSPEDLQDVNYPARDEYVFLDRGWRRGTVWLRVSRETVTAIGWHYQFGAP